MSKPLHCFKPSSSFLSFFSLSFSNPSITFPLHLFKFLSHLLSQFFFWRLPPSFSTTPYTYFLFFCFSVSPCFSFPFYPLFHHLSFFIKLLLSISLYLSFSFFSSLSLPTRFRSLSFSTAHFLSHFLSL